MRTTAAVLACLIGSLALPAPARAQSPQPPVRGQAPAQAAPAPAPAAPPSTVLALKASKENSLAELKLGLYALEDPPLAAGPTEQQRPTDAWRLKSLGLALRSDPAFECRKHASIEAALSADNRRQAADCLFAAELTLVVDKTRRYQLSATCADWQDNVARCALVPDGGQFWLTRDGVQNPKRFNLVLGPSKNDVRFPPPKGGPAYAMLVKPAVTKPAGKARPQGPLWLTWPEKSVMLKFTR